MEITLRIDWSSMIEGTTQEALDTIDEEATMRKYAREATYEVGREYPNADIDVKVVRTAPSVTTVIDPYDAEIVSDLDDILEKVWNGQKFWVDKKSDINGGGREMKKQYMNPATGSVDDYDGWWYEDETGTEVNGVDQEGLIEVVRNASGDWEEV